MRRLVRPGAPANPRRVGASSPCEQRQWMPKTGGTAEVRFRPVTRDGSFFIGHYRNPIWDHRKEDQRNMKEMMQSMRDAALKAILESEDVDSLEGLRVRYLGRSIADVLNMSFDEALQLFEGQSKIEKILRAVCDCGLGYIKLGQPSPTLSGGEAQRMKLATEIAKTSRTKTLFIFDEPTTGLHPDDVSQLISVFNRLADMGHTIVIIEHNLDIIKTSDYLIDIGPEPGIDGGSIVAVGTPEQVAATNASHTGRYLKTLLG